MTVLTLLLKTSNDTKLKQIDKALKLELNELKIETIILGTIADGWVQIRIEGEDEEVATNYVIKELGLCPKNFENVKKLSTMKGYIRNIKKSDEQLAIDVGVFNPKTIYATIPLRHLQAELVDARNFSLKNIAELFGFCDGLPMKVTISGLDEEKSQIFAELSNGLVRKYAFWRDSLLDRLMVLGPSLYKIMATIERLKLDRDVIDVEPLGLFEHALTCKLGTDATGLIPKIGGNLKSARFAVFNPKSLREHLSA